MSNEKKAEVEETEAVEEEIAEESEGTDENEELEISEPEIEEPTIEVGLTELEQKDAEIEKLQGEITDFKDRFVRNQAELENFKRRKTDEAKERLKYASQGFARDVIQGLDNLELALAHATPEGDEKFKNFVQGIEMVKTQLSESLKKNNIERIDPVGETFDPNCHEAVGMVDSDEVEDGAVALVMQAGYLLHDRVIRPAMVQVCKKA